MKKKELAEQILGNVTQAVNDLQNSREFSALMPEVRVNIVFALPGAKSGREVAAIDGRITVVRGYPCAAGSPGWGASDHMARLIIEARRYNGDINAGINFKCDSEIIKVVKSTRGIITLYLAGSTGPGSRKKSPASTEVPCRGKLNN